MYNPCGAWLLGQVFPTLGVPAVHTDNGRTLASGLSFAEITVVIKLLNTTADAAGVPYLRFSAEWKANGHVQFGPDKYSPAIVASAKLI